MTYRHSGTAVAVCLGALSLAGCSDRDFPTAPTARQVLQVGQTASGTISSKDDTCEFWSVEEGWVGLCNAFEITAPASGVLRATVRWPADAPLALFAKTSTGRQIDLACCDTPMVLDLPVDSGITYLIELAYVGRPPGYPKISAVAYTIETALLPMKLQ